MIALVNLKIDKNLKEIVILKIQNRNQKQKHWNLKTDFKIAFLEIAEG
jgi:hypothetical protein